MRFAFAFAFRCCGLVLGAWCVSRLRSMIAWRKVERSLASGKVYCSADLTVLKFLGCTYLFKGRYA